MSSLFGSKSKQKSTSTVTPFTGQYADQANQVKDWVWNKQNKGATSYTGNLSAPINTALTNTTDTINSYLNNNVLNKFANGDYLSPTSNPYALATYDIGSNKLLDAFSKVNDTLGSNYNASGLYNSSMRTNAQQKAADSTKQQLGDYGTNFWNTQYQQSINDMLQAIQARSGLANNALSANQYTQSLNQSDLDRQYAEFKRQQDEQAQNLLNTLNYLNIVKNPTTTTNSTTKTPGLFG